MTIQNSACLVTADQEFAKINTLTVINCLNQDLQDFRIYRMKDLFADEVANLTVINCLNQNFQDFRIYRMRYPVVNW